MSRAAMLVSSPQGRLVAAADRPVEEEPACGRTWPAGSCPGPELWLEELEDLDRRGLLEQLLAGGVIDEAAATAPDGHQLDRALNAKNTLLCVLAGCLFPGEGYDGVLRIALGMPGLDLKPGTKTPTGPALSKARALSGEQVTRRAFELDAARSDVDLGIGSACHGMETTSFDGTTAEVPTVTSWPMRSACPRAARNPRSASSRSPTGSRRWIGAAAGEYHDGENTLVDELAGTLRPGMLNLADRASSWTGGSGSPPPGRSRAGGSRTAPGPCRSRPSRPSPTAPSWSFSTSRTGCWPSAAATPATRTHRACPIPSSARSRG